MLRRRTFLAAAAAGTATPLLSEALGASARAFSLDKVLAHGLRVPWGLAFLPNGDALVGERPSGRVHRVRKSGGRHLVGTIRSAVDFGEGGLLGIAIGPNFANDREVYFYLTTSVDNRIIRKAYEGGGLGATEVILSGIKRTSGGSTNHHGGRIAFGPDGMLYAGVGDAGDPSRAQDVQALNGKILRMTPSGGVPGDNPFVAQGGNARYVWTMGHRNVQGLAWDSSGQMWASEFGQSTTDELNKINKGGNYGWPDVEGNAPPGQPGITYPFTTWSPTSTCSPSGLAIANGHAWVGALAGRCLFEVPLSGGSAGDHIKHLDNTRGRIRTVAHAPDGSLWVTTSNNDGSHDTKPRDDKVIRYVI